jgi:hypothetical protein
MVPFSRKQSPSLECLEKPSGFEGFHLVFQRSNKSPRYNRFLESDLMAAHHELTAFHDSRLNMSRPNSKTFLANKKTSSTFEKKMFSQKN